MFVVNCLRGTGCLLCPTLPQAAAGHGAFSCIFCWRPERFMSASNHRTTETSDHRDIKGSCKTSRKRTDGPARKSNDSLITERSDYNELIRTRSGTGNARSEENTSELQSLMRIEYDDFCLKKK